MNAYGGLKASLWWRQDLPCYINQSSCKNFILFKMTHVEDKKTLRAIAQRLYNYHLREAKKGSLIVSINDPLKRTCAELGVHRQTLVRWLQSSDIKQSTKMSTSYGRKKQLDEFDIDTIQRCMLRMFQQKTYVMLILLQSRLLTECELHVRKSTLYRSLRSMGYKYRPSQSGRRFLKERQDLVHARIAYLR